jgi:2-methylcitrate dehydratase PrpD
MLGIESYLRIDLLMAVFLAARGQYNDGVVGTIGSTFAIGKLFGLDEDNL